MSADITLVNLNMLFMRYGEEIERALHVPLGPLYLTRALEDAGFSVDFRDYQCVDSDDPFDMQVFVDFLRDPAPVIGLSCMANLLPFTILAIRALREAYPDRTIVLGGVGSTAVEEKILRRFPWVNIICRSEGERTGPELLRAIQAGNDLASVDGISFHDGNGTIRHNPKRQRITDLDSIPFPAFHKIDLSRYAGYGMMTSRGCPYLCTFCSVAPVWSLESYSRGPKNIVDEMEFLHREAGVDLFLFQDEFFVSGKRQVMTFCRELSSRGLDVSWKAFGRVNLVDEEMMRAMAENGCVELRFGIESGSDRVLKQIKKGFNTAQAMEVVPAAVKIFRRVDTFFVWGFPFETMEDFHQSLFQMVSFRMLGARILPSLLSLLPQTEVYREWSEKAELEFCPYLFPEFVFTGHEVCQGGTINLPDRYGEYFDLITGNPDIFPGFFHIDLEGNVLPKLALLRQFGFYPEPQPTKTPKAAAPTRHASKPRIWQRVHSRSRLPSGTCRSMVRRLEGPVRQTGPTAPSTGSAFRVMRGIIHSRKPARTGLARRAFVPDDYITTTAWRWTVPRADNANRLAGRNGGTPRQTHPGGNRLRRTKRVDFREGGAESTQVRNDLLSASC